MDAAFGAEPAPIARTLVYVIKLRDDIRAKRITMKRVAAARETSIEELREYLVLAELAPVVRDHVLGMTTVTANELVTEKKLRFIARERNHVEQRRMYERLLAGQLRCTRAGWRPKEGTTRARHSLSAAAETAPLGQLPEQLPELVKLPSISSALG